ncbi:MAG: helix-turn-helix transcriptional regulator [Fimbriimonadales bacterium]
MQSLAGMPCLGFAAAPRLPAVKWATKVELYHSLVAGRAFLESHYSGGASLRSAATAACMSPYHFNRLFRILFRQTPHDFLTTTRLQEARRMLASTPMSLAEIAFAVGFKEASSFSRLFRQRYWMSPTEFRAAGRGSEEH